MAPTTPNILIVLLWVGRYSYAFRIVPSCLKCPLVVDLTLTTHIRAGSIHAIEEEDKASEEDSVDLNTEENDSSGKEGNSTVPVAGDDTEDGVVDVQFELVDDPTIDEDSSANVDRMEYADAYDFEEEEPIPDYGSSAATGSVEWHTTVPILKDATVESEATLDENTEKSRLETIKEDEEEEELGTIRLGSEITEEMERIMLTELQYTPKDLKVMRPEIASIVVAKRVHRPIEGLPPNWNKEGSAPVARKFGINSQALKLARKVAIGVFACAVMVIAGSKVGELKLPNIQFPYQKKTKVLSQAAAPVDDFYQHAFALIGEADPTTNVQEAVVAEEEEQEHSVRPCEKPDKEPSDKTWLDKVITAIERRFKKLFGFRL